MWVKQTKFKNITQVQSSWMIIGKWIGHQDSFYRKDMGIILDTPRSVINCIHNAKVLMVNFIWKQRVGQNTFFTLTYLWTLSGWNINLCTISECAANYHLQSALSVNTFRMNCLWTLSERTACEHFQCELHMNTFKVNCLLTTRSSELPLKSFRINCMWTLSEWTAYQHFQSELPINTFGVSCLSTLSEWAVCKHYQGSYMWTLRGFCLWNVSVHITY